MLGALWEAAQRFNAKSGWVMSSHVAMSMMLALFPFVIFLVAVAGQFTQGLDQDQLIGLTLDGWPDAVADPIERELRAVVSAGTGGLMSVGGILALYFASNGVDAVAMAMSRAYHIGEQRPFWRRRLLAILVVIGAAALVLAVAFLGVALPLYSRFVLGEDTALYRLIFDSRAARLAIGTTLAAIVVLSCHLILPGRGLHLREVWPGLVLTVLAWAAAAQGFGIYLAKFASYSATYAGLAGAMAGLIFLYLMAAILIFGAEFNGALLDRRRSL
ncbi:MAG: YihY/virulence factor BrkB family protein [Marinibacterium sp.]